MSQPVKKIIALFILLVANVEPVQATKLSAPPLPHRSDFQPFNGQEIAPPVTRYNRTPAATINQDDSTKDNGQTSSKQPDKPSQEEVAKVKVDKQRKLEALAANNKAVQLGKLGKFEEAISAHEEAVRLDPENKQFRINLSAAYCAYGQKQLAKNNIASSVHFFRQSLVAASDNALAGRLLIESLKKMGINPNSADDRLTLGDDLIAQGDLAGAGIEYQAAEQLEQSARTFVKMGDYAYQLGQMDLAANWYSQATVKDAEYGPAYRQLGFIALAKQDQSQAANLLRKAIILDSKDKAAGLTLVDLWRKQVAANPQIAENHLGLASSLQLTGDLSGAELEYKKVASLDPHNPSLPAAQASLKNAYRHAEAQRHAAAANTLWNQNLKQEALTEMAQAVQIEPKNAQYQFSLAECLEATGDLKGAHQAYLTCVLIDPENNAQAAARMRALQQSYANQTSTPASTQNLNSSSQSEANKPSEQNIAQGNSTAESNKNTILENIQALEMAHNYDQAISLLKELVSNNLENPNLHHQLAVDLMSNGEIGEAISEFRIASALSPEQKNYAADLAQALNINKEAMKKIEQPINSSETKSQLNTTSGTKQ